MASRKYEQFQLSLEKEVVTLYANIPIGSTGAVGTLDPKKNQGIYSVVRADVGQYVITFGAVAQKTLDKYRRLLMTKDSLILATPPAASYQMSVLLDASAAGAITIQFSAAGSAVELDSGSVLLLEIALKNSTV